MIPDDDYLVPVISEIFCRHTGFKYVSVIDLESGYNQFPVHPDDQPKLAFTWKNHQYMFAACPFGLKHLPAQFHRTVHAILTPHAEYAENFLDDISIFSNSLDDHIYHVAAVIRTLTSANLRINWEKSHLGFTKVRLLGHILSGSERMPDHQKLRQCLNLPRPVTGKQIESYLGAMNYLRDYIPRYADIAAPLERLRHVIDVEAVWNDDCEQAYQCFREALKNPLTLSVPQYDLPFHLATDASQNGVAAVLYQEIDKKRQYIAVLAKALAPAQRNYPATKRELLAIVWALTRLREHLYGHRTIIYTDHKALEYLLTQKQANYMVANWSDILLDFNIEIVHRPGISMVLPDALSRLFVQLEGREAQSPDQPQVRLQLVEGDSHPKELHQFIKERLGKTLPNDKEKAELVQNAHQTGHFGAEQMFKQLWWKGYYWPTLREECKQEAARCATCQQWNIKREGFHPMTSVHAEYPWEHIAMDLAGPLPTTKSGFNMILVITDICSRFTLIRPLRSKLAKDVARELYKAMADFGVPKIIQSDNGREFVNKVIAEMTNLLGVEHRLITPYHPEANGAAESAVKVIKKVLLKVSKGDVYHWEKYLPTVQIMANQRIMKRTGSRPFELFYGRPLNLWIDYQNMQSKPATPEQLKAHYDQLKKVVYPSIFDKSKSAGNQERYNFDQQHNTDKPLEPGTKVMIKQVDRQAGDTEYAGPYTVQRVNKGGAYILVDVTGQEFPHRVPRKHIKVIELPPAVKTESNPSESEEELEYEIEKVLDHKRDGPTTKYLVKWKGYPHSQNSWITQEKSTGNQAIAAYWRSKSTRAKEAKSTSGSSNLEGGDVGKLQHKRRNPKLNPRPPQHVIRGPVASERPQTWNSDRTRRGASNDTSPVSIRQRQAEKSISQSGNLDRKKSLRKTNQSNHQISTFGRC